MIWAPNVMCTATLESPTYSGMGPGATAEAPGHATTAQTQNVTVPAELLDGGEIVILAIKPSPWFILFDSVKWLTAGLVVIVGGALTGGQLELISYAALVQIATILMATRAAVSLLRWVSRFYVLTNRRVLQIRGVLRANVLDMALIDILNTRVTYDCHERAVGIGTLRFACKNDPPGDPHWSNVARPEELHTEVRRAIERAIDQQPQE